MKNNGISAIVKKDLRQITANKRMLFTLLIVPLVLTVFLPTVSVLCIYFIPDQNGDFQRLLALLPATEWSGNYEKTLSALLFNYILPVFFLIIPVMAASIMAASSFVGEREKHTLETLLYCPLSLNQIFYAKVLASFLLSMTVSLISFGAMALVLECELFFIAGSFLIPDLKWLLIMLLVSPAISVIAITLIVRLSARAESMEDAQQSAVFLLLPILLLVVGQFTGVLLVSTWLLSGIGILCTLAAFILLKKSMKNFSYELLLK